MRDTARAAVWPSYPAANRVTRGWASRIPATVSTAVSSPITDRKFPPNRKAASFPFFAMVWLNTGMKQAAMAEANTTSKKTLGIRLAI